MYILDTNVLSTLMSPRPVAAVVQWVDQRDSRSLYLSAVTVGEIRYGVALLAEGRRRRDLERRFALLIARGFERRVLPYDASAANAYGELMAARREIGRPLTVADGQIAAIARAAGFAVVTRNVRDFDDCGVEVIDPFGGVT